MYLTERQYEPLTLSLGRNKKLPCLPSLFNKFSACTPVMLVWNQLKQTDRLH